MTAGEITQQQVLEELEGLDSSRWYEVLDFIGYLKDRTKGGPTRRPQRALSAQELLQSGLVGLWADRDDIADSVAFARRMREQAERRHSGNDDADRH